MKFNPKAIGPIQLLGGSSALRRFVIALASALVATRAGEGILFEQVLGHPTVDFYVTDDALVRSAHNTAGSPVPSFPRRSASTLPPRDPHWSRAIGLLAPVETIGESDARRLKPGGGGGKETAHSDWPATEKSPAPGAGRTAIQTFWISRAGTIWVARRWEVALPTEYPERPSIVRSVGLTLAREWSDRVHRPVRPEWLQSRRRTEREWDRGRLARVGWAAGVDLPTPRVAATATYGIPDPWRMERAIQEHLVVFGTSGSGKTSTLARMSAEAVANGRSVVVIDVHGDLALAISNAVPPQFRERIAAVDVTTNRVPGISILEPGDPEQSIRVGAHLVSALKRLTPDGSELYWGFRLERIFDSFVRIVVDEGGDLKDLLGLLTDPRRRESAQLSTRNAELARFLGELPALERRNPEFLWSAAARVAKISMSPALLALLAPGERALPLDSLLQEGSVIVFRIPFGAMGAEASALVATLLLSRIYLSRADPRRLGSGIRPLLLVIDEAQSIAPRLLTEILAEGRKFGVAAHLATQYPERLAPEVRAAAAGAVRSHLLLNLAPIAAASAGAWVGLTADTAVSLLPHLPPGRGLLDRGSLATDFQEVELPPPPELDARAWERSVIRTGELYDVPPLVAVSTPAPERLDTVLRAILANETKGAPVALARIVSYVTECSNEPVDGAQIVLWLQGAERRGLVQGDSRGWQMTPAGERALGIGIRTGAARESAEHRALLNRAVRLFARRGLALEVVMQGRFDSTLPDGRVRLLACGPHALPTPRELAETVHRIEGSWGWEFFDGQDVHVEAEVSGALRPDRIRRGLRKARAHHAFALFLVSDDRRANRVRTVLRAAGAYPHHAQVWTLRGEGLFELPPGSAGNR